MENNNIDNNNRHRNRYFSDNSNTFQSNKFFIIILSLLVGLIFGYIICALSVKTHLNKITIAYISQKEIMELERDRLSKLQNEKDKELFYGRHDQAIDLIQQKAKSISRDNVKVVFSNDKIYGSDVFSISKQVYLDVIERIREEKEMSAAIDRETNEDQFDEVSDTGLIEEK